MCKVRKINFYILIVVLMAINVSFASCEGNNSSSSPQIYVVGFTVDRWNNTRATLWINGEPQTLSDDYSKVNSVFISDDNVYVVGSLNDRATLWTNGIPEPLSDIRSEAYSVFVSNKRVYVAGLVYPTDSIIITQATIWIDGIQRTISTDSYSGAFSISVSGNDIYVAGTTDIYLGRSSRARLWINGLPRMLYEASRSWADSVFISENVIYVAGAVSFLLQGDLNLSSRATLWINGIQQTLSETSSSASSVYVEGNNVYVAGYIGGAATLWINGVLQTLREADEHSFVDVESVFVLNGITYVAGTIYI